MSTYAGQIIDIDPTQGCTDDTIRIRIVAGSQATFKSTSNHRFFLEPHPRPPGATFFGYELQHNIIDTKNATAIVPPIGPNQPFEMPEGSYRLIVVTGRDWADSAEVFEAKCQANYTPGFQGNIFSSTRPLKEIIKQTIPLPTIATVPPTPLGPGAGQSLGNASQTNYGGLMPASVASVPRDVPQGGIAILDIGQEAGTPQEEMEEPAERRVTWVVRASNLVRKGEGPEMRIVSYRSEPIPVERKKGSAPIRYCDFIVSAQIQDPQGNLSQNEWVTWLFNDPYAPIEDDSSIIEVSGDLNALIAKLEAGDTSKGPNHALTNDQGEVYCLKRIRLFEEAQLGGPEAFAKPFEILIGESLGDVPEEVLASPSFGEVADRILSTGGGDTPQIFTTTGEEEVGLWDVLVDPLQKAVESTFKKVMGGFAMKASASIARTDPRVIGFFLKRMADGIISICNLEGSAMVLAKKLNKPYDPEHLRSLVIGMMLGVPRGIWVMGRDQVEDIKSLVVDLPRALFDMIAKEPGRPLIVLGTPLPVGFTVLVGYTLGKKFNEALQENMALIAGSTVKMASTVDRLLVSMVTADEKDIRIAFGISLAKGAVMGAKVVTSLPDLFYDSFEKFVGFIPRDYLRYKKDSTPHHYFILSFIAGDFLGYIVGTVGVEALLAILTEGVATLIKGLTKIARSSKVAAKLIGDLVEAFNDLKKAIGKIGKAARGRLSEAVVRAMLAAIRFIDELEPRFLKSFLAALAESSKETRDRTLRWLYRYGKDGDGARMAGMAKGLKKGLPEQGGREGRAKDVIELLAELAEPKKDLPSIIPSCRKKGKLGK